MPPPSQNLPATGLQQPALQNRFVTVVEGTPKEFNLQIVAFGMNLAKKEIVLFVEQSMNHKEHVTIQDWIDNPKRKVAVEILDAQLAVLDTLVFHECVIIDHVAEFNYASTSPVYHEVLCQYDKVDLGNGTASNAYSHAMSIIGGRP